VVSLDGGLGRPTAADLDGDGRADLAITDLQGDQVAVLRNTCSP
jgi:hypothetical protein